MARKTHLAIGFGRTACGLTTAKALTSRPEDVTCLGCKRTVRMADAEVQQTHQTPRF